MTHQLKGREEEAAHVETLLPSHHYAEVYQRKVWLRPLAIVIAVAIAIAIVVVPRTCGRALGAVRHLQTTKTRKTMPMTNQQQ